MMLAFDGRTFGPRSLSITQPKLKICRPHTVREINNHLGGTEKSEVFAIEDVTTAASSTAAPASLSSKCLPTGTSTSYGLTSHTVMPTSPDACMSSEYPAIKQETSHVVGDDWNTGSSILSTQSGTADNIFIKQEEQPDSSTLPQCSVQPSSVGNLGYQYAPGAPSTSSGCDTSWQNYNYSFNSQFTSNFTQNSHNFNKPVPILDNPFDNAAVKGCGGNIRATGYTKGAPGHSAVQTSHDVKPEEVTPICAPSLDIPPNLHGDDLDLASKYLRLELEFSQALSHLQFTSPVSYIYNPLAYAWEPHSEFVKKYLRGPVDVLFLGMNPGPYGMAQTGVPFGEVSIVKEWLGIVGNVGRPEREHPKRPIQGFQCQRKEVSGTRFWGFFKDTCKRPEVFFRHCFVHNICPLIFMNENAKNLTPPAIHAAQRNPLNNLCHQNICDLVKLLQVKVIVGVGKFAMDQAIKALGGGGIEHVRVVSVMHPSPANPAANRGWEPIIQKQLEDLELLQYIRGDIPIGEVP